MDASPILTVSNPFPKNVLALNSKATTANITRRSLDEVNRLIDAGPFEVKVARTFTLDQAADAQRALNDHYLGKLALITK